MSGGDEPRGTIQEFLEVELKCKGKQELYDRLGEEGLEFADDLLLCPKSDLEELGLNMMQRARIMNWKDVNGKHYAGPGAAPAPASSAPRRRSPRARPRRREETPPAPPRRRSRSRSTSRRRSPSRRRTPSRSRTPARIRSRSGRSGRFRRDSSSRSAERWRGRSPPGSRGGYGGGGYSGGGGGGGGNAAVAEAVEQLKQPYCNSLKLVAAGIDDDAAEQLARGLQEHMNERLRNIYLQKNSIGPRGGEALLRVLEKACRRPLNHIELTGNPDLPDSMRKRFDALSSKGGGASGPRDLNRRERR